jgi:hypothetical protein
MNMQINWAEHYKAVSARLGKAPVTAPRVTLPKQQSAVMKAEPATLYRQPIGPKINVRKSYVGWVVYPRRSSHYQFTRKLRYYARLQRPPMPIDKILYARPIGPHNTFYKPLVRTIDAERLNKARDIIRVSSDPSRLSARAIVQEVMAKHGVSGADFFSGRRFPHIIHCRHEACYRLRHETTLSLTGIARVVGMLDHTSVRSAIIKYESENAAAATANGR